MRGKKIQDQGLLCQRNNLFQSNRPIPYQITTRQQICYGHGRLVENDSNVILLELPQNQNRSRTICGHDSSVTRLRRTGVVPKKHVLDNESSEKMKTTFKIITILELVPPGCHRRNATKVSICNFKAHFLSVLASIATSLLPPNLWDCLLPQTEITLNLLRQSNATPSVSVYVHLSGPLDYNKMPLAPMGCKVLVHEKTDNSGTWAYQCVDGWYLNTSPEHYRVHNCLIKGTHAERLSDTVQYHVYNWKLHFLNGRSFAGS